MISAPFGYSQCRESVFTYLTVTAGGYLQNIIHSSSVFIQMTEYFNGSPRSGSGAQLVKNNTHTHHFQNPYGFGKTKMMENSLSISEPCCKNDCLQSLCFLGSTEREESRAQSPRWAQIPCSTKLSTLPAPGRAALSSAWLVAGLWPSWVSGKVKGGCRLVRPEDTSLGGEARRACPPSTHHPLDEYTGSTS